MVVSLLSFPTYLAIPHVKKIKVIYYHVNTLDHEQPYKVRAQGCVQMRKQAQGIERPPYLFNPSCTSVTVTP